MSCWTSLWSEAGSSEFHVHICSKSLSVIFLSFKYVDAGLSIAMALSGRHSYSMLVAGVVAGVEDFEPSLLVCLWNSNTAGGGIAIGRIRDGVIEGMFNERCGGNFNVALRCSCSS